MTLEGVSLNKYKYNSYFYSLTDGALQKSPNTMLHSRIGGPQTYTYII